MNLKLQSELSLLLATDTSAVPGTSDLGFRPLGFRV